MIHKSSPIDFSNFVAAEPIVYWQLQVEELTSLCPTCLPFTTRRNPMNFTRYRMQCQPLKKLTLATVLNTCKGDQNHHPSGHDKPTNQRHSQEALGHHGPNDFQQGPPLSILVALNQSNRSRCWFSLGGNHLWWENAPSLSPCHLNG